MPDIVVMATPRNALPTRITTGPVLHDPVQDGDAIYDWMCSSLPCSTVRRVAARCEGAQLGSPSAAASALRRVEDALRRLDIDGARRILTEALR